METKRKYIPANQRKVSTRKFYEALILQPKPNEICS